MHTTSIEIVIYYYRGAAAGYYTIEVVGPLLQLIHNNASASHLFSAVKGGRPCVGVPLLRYSFSL